MFRAIHYIYYVNRPIATKVDSTYLGYRPTTHSVLCLEARAGRKPVTFRSQSPTISLYTTHVDVNAL